MSESTNNQPIGEKYLMEYDKDIEAKLDFQAGIIDERFAFLDNTINITINDSNIESKTNKVENSKDYKYLNDIACYYYNKSNSLNSNSANETDKNTKEQKENYIAKYKEYFDKALEAYKPNESEKQKDYKFLFNISRSYFLGDKPRTLTDEEKKTVEETKKILAKNGQYSLLATISFFERSNLIKIVKNRYGNTTKYDQIKRKHPEDEDVKKIEELSKKVYECFAKQKPNGKDISNKYEIYYNLAYCTEIGIGIGKQGIDVLKGYYEEFEEKCKNEQYKHKGTGYNRLGIICYKQGNVKKAIEYFEKAASVGYEKAKNNLELLEKRKLIKDIEQLKPINDALKKHGNNYLNGINDVVNEVKSDVKDKSNTTIQQLGNDTTVQQPDNEEKDYKKMTLDELRKFKTSLESENKKLKEENEKLSKNLQEKIRKLKSEKNKLVGDLAKEKSGRQEDVNSKAFENEQLRKTNTELQKKLQAQAEAKTKETQQKLEEANKQINNLKEQAQAAEQAKAAAEAARQAQAEAAEKKQKELDEANAQLTEENNKLKEDAKTAENTKKGLEGQINVLKKKAETAEKQNAQLQAQAAADKETQKKLEDENEKLKKEAEAKAEQARVEAEAVKKAWAEAAEKTKKELDEVKKDLEDANNKKEQLNNQLQAQTEAIKKTQEELEKKNNDLENQLNEAKTKAEEVEKARVEAETKAEKKQKELEDANDRITRLEKDNDTKQEDIKNKQNQIDSLTTQLNETQKNARTQAEAAAEAARQEQAEAAEKTQKELEIANNQITQLKNENAQLAKEKEELERQKKNFESKYKREENIRKNIESKLTEERNKNKKLENDLKAKEANLNEVKTKLEKNNNDLNKAYTINNDLKTKLKTSENDKKELEQKTNNLSRLNELLVEKSKKLEGQANNLQKENAQLKKEAEAIAEKARVEAKTAKEKQEELEKTNAQLTKEKEELEDKIKDYKKNSKKNYNEIEKLKTTLSSTKAAEENLEENLKNKSNALLEANKLKDKLSWENAQLKNQLNEQTKKAEETQKELNEANKQNEDLASENTQLQTKAKKQNEEQQKQITDLTNKNTALNEELEKYKQLAEKLQQEKLQLEEDKRNLNDNLEKQKNENENLREEFSFSDAGIEWQKQEIEDLQEVNKDQNEQINNLKNDIEVVKKEAFDTQLILDDKEKQIEQLNNNIETQQKTIDEKDKAIKEKDKEIERLRKELEDLKQKKSETKLEISGVTSFDFMAEQNKEDAENVITREVEINDKVDPKKEQQTQNEEEEDDPEEEKGDPEKEQTQNEKEEDNHKEEKGDPEKKQEQNEKEEDGPEKEQGLDEVMDRGVKINDESDPKEEQDEEIKTIGGLKDNPIISRLGMSENKGGNISNNVDDSLKTFSNEEMATHLSNLYYLVGTANTLDGEGKAGLAVAHMLNARQEISGVDGIVPTLNKLSYSIAEGITKGEMDIEGIKNLVGFDNIDEGRLNTIIIDYKNGINGKDKDEKIKEVFEKKLKDELYGFLDLEFIEKANAISGDEKFLENFYKNVDNGRGYVQQAAKSETIIQELHNVPLISDNKIDKNELTKIQAKINSALPGNDLIQNDSELNINFDGDRETLNKVREGMNHAERVKNQFNVERTENGEITKVDSLKEENGKKWTNNKSTAGLKYPDDYSPEYVNTVEKSGNSINVNLKQEKKNFDDLTEEQKNSLKALFGEENCKTVEEITINGNTILMPTKYCDWVELNNGIGKDRGILPALLDQMEKAAILNGKEMNSKYLNDLMSVTVDNKKMTLNEAEKGREAEKAAKTLLQQWGPNPVIKYDEKTPYGGQFSDEDLETVKRCCGAGFVYGIRTEQKKSITKGKEVQQISF